MNHIDTTLVGRAGHMLAPHAMCWVRRLNAPVEQVWPVVSTREGLATWWVAEPTVFQLEAGGRFTHHWSHTVLTFDAGRYIDFDEAAGSYVGTGGLRFELAAVGPTETVFTLVATWEPDIEAPDEENRSPAASARLGRVSPRGGTARWTHSSDSSSPLPHSIPTRCSGRSTARPSTRTFA